MIPSFLGISDLYWDFTFGVKNKNPGIWGSPLQDAGCYILPSWRSEQQGKSQPFGGKPVKNQVCIYWLQGRCNRNPCKFLHRESLPAGRSQTQKQPQLAPPSDIYSKKTKAWTWRNHNHDVSKRSDNSSNGVSMSNTTSDQNILKKVLTYNGKRGHRHTTIAPVRSDSVPQDQLKVTTAVRDEPAKRIVPKAQPKQCKYWATGSCVHREKCKDLHSWFCGSGFMMLAKLEGHTKAITGISLPSGCDKLYSGSKDGTIRVWNCYTGQCAGSVMIDGEVGCLVAEGPLLFAAFQNVVKAWNLQNQTEFFLNGPDESVCSMVLDEDKFFYWNTDSHFLYDAWIQDGTIMVWKWNIETNIPEPAAMLKGHRGAVCSLVIRDDRLYSGSRDCTIKVWDLQHLQCLQALYGHTRDVISVLCWESYLLSASLDKTLKIWCAAESGSIEVTNEIKEDHELMALCGIDDAEAKPILLCSLNDSTVCLYDLPSFTERGRIFSKQAVQVIRLGKNGLFFTGDANGEVYVWKMLEVLCATAS
ncbi:zinc finger WD40 repeat protein 1 [Perilla frutescens var. hirtella]|uniref:Zinc finger WD40 repeat protein 1 n=1 Tax=Perilla frutescens var. hirtella TaxID=608512 RepID=A0AAD4P9W3_PERFH|nr:zinc finger WD40 repeat protein 1 [Perilla frutescens var. hirtella]